MSHCLEYANVSSDWMGCAWQEQTSFADVPAVAPGASLKSEHATEFGNETDLDRESNCVDPRWKPWSHLDLKFAVPGSIDKNAQITSSLRDAIDLEFAGHVCEALDTVYSRTSEMIQLELISQLDDEIASIDPNEIGTDVLLGILTATLPVRSKVPSRNKLYVSAFEILKQRGHFEPGILDGLE